jgi:hypothetical protein
MHPRMLSQERIDLFGFVSRQVVCDDVYLLAARLVGHEVGEEGHELG